MVEIVKKHVVGRRIRAETPNHCVLRTETDNMKSQKKKKTGTHVKVGFSYYSSTSTAVSSDGYKSTLSDSQHIPTAQTEYSS